MLFVGEPPVSGMPVIAGHISTLTGAKWGRTRSAVTCWIRWSVGRDLKLPSRALADVCTTSCFFPMTTFISSHAFSRGNASNAAEVSSQLKRLKVRGAEKCPQSLPLLCKDQAPLWATINQTPPRFTAVTRACQNTRRRVLMILRTTPPPITAASPEGNQSTDYARSSTATRSSGEGRTKETRRGRHVYGRLVQNNHTSHRDPCGTLALRNEERRWVNTGFSCTKGSGFAPAGSGGPPTHASVPRSP